MNPDDPFAPANRPIELSEAAFRAGMEETSRRDIKSIAKQSALVGVDAEHWDVTRRCGAHDGPPAPVEDEIRRRPRPRRSGCTVNLVAHPGDHSIGCSMRSSSEVKNMTRPGLASRMTLT